MSTAIKTMDETKLAEEIVSVMDARVVRVCSDDRENVHFAVRGAMKLRSIVLGRAALRRLLHDRGGQGEERPHPRPPPRRRAPRGGGISFFPRRSALGPAHEQTATVLAV